MSRFDNTQRRKSAESFAQARSTDPKDLNQLPFRRQAVAGSKTPGPDKFQYAADDLLPEGLLLDATDRR